MNLWLVDNKTYVIADGPAGAAYLAKGQRVKLLKKDVERDFNPRLITDKKARQLELS